MSEATHIEKLTEGRTDEGLDERNVTDSDDRGRRQDSLGTTFQNFFSFRKRTSASTRDPKQDRTRALVVLVGGVIGSVLLFIAIFSTPPARSSERQREHAQPNLGRRETAAATKQASVTPLLNVQTQSDESGQDRVTAADVQNTSQRGAGEADPRQEMTLDDSVSLRNATSSAIDREAMYHRDGTTGTMTVYRGPTANAASRKTTPNSLYPATFTYGASAPQAPTSTIATTPKSSIVFVRTSVAPVGQTSPPSVAPVNVEHSALLPAGSRLIARLESAVTSALKAPVVAAIEYNYERDGVILIPAGTKAIGDMQQASTNGYVGITFHTLQMPDGRNEKIEAMAVDLQNEPLKGKVTGTNKGKKFVTRTLSGVGTIAAYVVPGGSGLGQPISGETLLRDRLAGNIASAGEQELTNASFSQNIVVTVPAQTRLYVVFRKAAVEQPANSSVSTATGRGNGSEMPTAQELRELLDLKREINRMYEASAAPPNPAKP
jgi:type IV secretory pathway VirB10-like protein